MSLHLGNFIWAPLLLSFSVNGTINPCHTSHLFQYPLKTWKSQSFSERSSFLMFSGCIHSTSSPLRREEGIFCSYSNHGFDGENDFWGGEGRGRRWLKLNVYKIFVTIDFKNFVPHVKGALLNTFIAW